MARAGLSRLDVKRARDSLIAQGQHPSIDAIRIALGNTGSKTTIHRYLKELEEEEGAALNRTGLLSDAIQDLVARLAARLHEEAQTTIDQHAAMSAAQRQQAQEETAKLASELAQARTELGQAHATITDVRAAHSDKQAALQQRTIEAGRLSQQAQDLIARLAEHEDFRRSLEDKLQHAHQALEHFRIASKEQRDQEARRHEQQVQQLQAELRQANQALIVKQGEITQLNKDGARLVAEAGVTARHVRELEVHGGRMQIDLKQVEANLARAEVERDALRATAQTQANECTLMSSERALLAAELTKLTARLEAQELLLTDYRMQLGVVAPPA